MKAVIAGGRDYHGTPEAYKWLRDALIENEVTKVLSGHCTGADFIGEQAAVGMDLELELFPADWLKFGRAAGPMRNQLMAALADICILFPGGRGTADMERRARKEGCKIIKYENG